MADKVTWTVEQIEAAAERQDQLVSLDISWGVRLDRAVENAAMLRAFAAQTRQIEQMRGILSDGAEGDIDFALFQFNRIFPKDGAQ